jgi:UDP-glucose 4-epimerase
MAERAPQLAPATDELAARFAGRRVLITGGLGFIGSNLARSLADHAAEIVLVDSLIPEYGGNLQNVAGIERQVKINIADVRDEYSMTYLVQNQDFLFNLAGQTSHLDSMSDPYTDLDINCRAQLSILEAVRKKNPAVKIVYASTRQVYGVPESLPVTESHPLHPTDVNGINKMAGERYYLLYNNVYGIRASALRLTNTYGPRMRVRDARQTFLGWWIRQAIEGEEIQIYGDGNQVRDLNYVDDVVAALLLAAACPEADGQVFNLGAPLAVSLKDLAALLLKLAGGGRQAIVPFPSELKAIDIGDYYGDFSRIRKALGWEPRVGLEDGLTRTLEFFRKYRAFYW